MSVAKTSVGWAEEQRVEAALKRGADELMNLAEHALLHRPRALEWARRAYRKLCLLLYRAIERAAKG